jgi:hypothetical protein
MADLDPPTSDGIPVQSERPASGAEPARAGPAGANHVPPKAAPGPDPAPHVANSDDRSGLDRAEEVVHHLADRVSSWVATWGRTFLRLSSRTREAAQDFWAEVRDFREGKKP